jgi:hypothetical protein
VFIGDYKQGQAVFVTAFRLLRYVIVRTLNDEENPFLKEMSTNNDNDKLSFLRLYQNSSTDSMIETIKTTQHDSSPSDMQMNQLAQQTLTSPSKEKRIEKVKRDRVWYTKAAYYLHQVFVKIFSISRRHQNIKHSKESQVLTLKSTYVHFSLESLLYFVHTRFSFTLDCCCCCCCLVLFSLATDSV